MTWTLVIAAAAFAAGWYFGHLETGDDETLIAALFFDMGEIEADLADERDRADYLAAELERRVGDSHSISNLGAREALDLHAAARRKDRS